MESHVSKLVSLEVYWFVNQCKLRLCKLMDCSFTASFCPVTMETMPAAFKLWLATIPEVILTTMNFSRALLCILVL